MASCARAYPCRQFTPVNVEAVTSLSRPYRLPSIRQPCNRIRGLISVAAVPACQPHSVRRRQLGPGHPRHTWLSFTYDHVT